MARCPICGEALKWEDLIEQMLSLENFRELLGDKQEFLKAFSEFIFKCPRCGEEFYGKALGEKEPSVVFELLNDFEGGIDYERRRVKLKLTNLLALNTMLEEWDRRTRK